jgi:hypothetical protein
MMSNIAASLENNAITYKGDYYFFSYRQRIRNELKELGLDQTNGFHFNLDKEGPLRVTIVIKGSIKAFIDVNLYKWNMSVTNVSETNGDEWTAYRLASFWHRKCGTWQNHLKHGVRLKAEIEDARRPDKWRVLGRRDMLATWLVNCLAPERHSVVSDEQKPVYCKAQP